MTVTVNNNKIEQTILQLAQKLAAKTGDNVIIFEAEIGDEKKQFIATETELNGSPNKNELKTLAIIDKNGNYVD